MNVPLRMRKVSFFFLTSITRERNDPLQDPLARPGHRLIYGSLALSGG